MLFNIQTKNAFKNEDVLSICNKSNYFLAESAAIARSVISAIDPEALIAVSKFSGMKTKQVFGFKNFDFEVIYNGIDTTRFNPIEGINENHSILYFGTLARKVIKKSEVTTQDS